MNTYLGLDNYRRNLERLGWAAEDLKPRGSDRLFDAMVAWGNPDKIAESVCHHLDADHLAVQVLTSTPDIAPLDDLRRLAPLLL